jgi:hypothetical protein
MNNWEIAANVSTVVSSIVLVITLLFGLRQLVEMKRATNLSLFIKILDILQTEDVRNARRIVLSALKDKHYTSWMSTEIHEAEKVCHTYNTVGRILRFSACPKHIVIRPARDSILKTWYILKPLVKKYQDERGTDFYEDYEWLVFEAERTPPDKVL